MKKEELIDFHIRYTWQKISRIYNAEAVKYGLTMSTAFILLNIDEEKGTPSTKLGPKMGMEANSLTRILKSMEAKGLIYKKPSLEDKRVVLLFLTELGVKNKQTALDNVLKFNNFVYQKMSPMKVRQFIETITELEGVLSSEEIFKSSLLTNY